MRGINGSDNFAPGNGTLPAVAEPSGLCASGDAIRCTDSGHPVCPGLAYSPARVPDSTTFTYCGCGGGTYTSVITGAAITADGKFIAGGYVTPSGSSSGDFAVARYNSPSGLEQRLFVIQDANHNVAAVTDAFGNVVERYEYDPHGLRTIYSSTYSVRGSSSYAFVNGFQGLGHDTVTGWLYARNRWLIASLQTWNRMDPIGYPDGMNAYQFVLGNPVASVDPAGLEDWLQLPPAWPGLIGPTHPPKEGVISSGPGRSLTNWPKLPGIKPRGGVQFPAPRRGLAIPIDWVLEDGYTGYVVQHVHIEVAFKPITDECKAAASTRVLDFYEWWPFVNGVLRVPVDILDKDRRVIPKEGILPDRGTPHDTFETAEPIIGSSVTYSLWAEAKLLDSLDPQYVSRAEHVEFSGGAPSSSEKPPGWDYTDIAVTRSVKSNFEYWGPNTFKASVLNTR